MKKLIWLMLIGASLVLAGGVSNAEIVRRKAVVAPTFEINKLRSADTLKLIGKRTEFTGFYYDGSIPMVIDKIERVQCNLPIPDDAYIPIVGKIPASLRSGDKISIAGTLVKAIASDPKWALEEPAVIRLSDESDVKVISQASVIAPIARRFKLRDDLIRLLATDYAVLIVGGINAGNNHLRYWNELKSTYTALKARGLTDANIYVLYADGVARDNSVVVDYAATKANIATVFTAIAAQSTDSSGIYIMTDDHGGGYSTRVVGDVQIGNYGGVLDTNGDENDNLSEASLNRDINGDGDKNDLVSVDEVLCLWGENITDDEFAADVNKITKYAKMVIQMEQCFSGGFVNDLAGPRRVIMSACGDTECSWAKASDYVWNEFTYSYLAAWTGAKPDGGGAVNADTNGDGKLSTVECFNYARAHDTQPETPFFEDNGQRPGHSGQMPSQGEGTLGSTTVF